MFRVEHSQPEIIPLDAFKYSYPKLLKKLGSRGIQFVGSYILLLMVNYPPHLSFI